MSTENNTSSDEAVSQFLALTGSSDASQAKLYLEMSANDLQTALNLYMEHQSGGGGGFGTSSSNSNTDYASTSGSAAGAAGGVGFGNDDNVRKPDETRRMRLMDFEGPTGALMSGVGGGNDLGGLLNHPVLGPHAAAMMNLNREGMGGMMDHDFLNMPPHLSAFADTNTSSASSSSRNTYGREHAMQMGMGNVRDMINAATSANTENDNYDDDNDDDYVQVIGSTTSTATNTGLFQNQHSQQHAQRLNDLFAAPVHLIHSAGGFQGARNVAKDTRRWLLVNLQCDADFSCHALNRDVWRDELVENLVREGFIFWQSVNDSPDGRTYAQRYNVESYPHIGIIDPRTARLVFRKEGWTQENPLTAEKFAEMAVDFCSRNSFDKPPSIPRGDIGSGGISSNVSSSVRATNTSSASVEQMTEEEQLQAAIRASMNEASGINQSGGGDNDDDFSDDENDVYIMEDSDVDYDNDDDAEDDVKDTTMDMGNDDEEKTFHDEIMTVDVGDEASATDGTENIQETECKVTMETDRKTMEKEDRIEKAKKILFLYGEEPSSSSNSSDEKYTRIRLMLPSGQRIERRFRGKETIDTVKSFLIVYFEEQEQLSSDRNAGSSSNKIENFQLCSNYPRKVLVNGSATLESEGLCPQAVIMVQNVDA